LLHSLKTVFIFAHRLRLINSNTVIRLPVLLHGTHCPNTSVLNLTFVFLVSCWRHIFVT